MFDIGLSPDAIFPAAQVLYGRSGNFSGCNMALHCPEIQSQLLGSFASGMPVFFNMT